MGSAVQAAQHGELQGWSHLQLYVEAEALIALIGLSVHCGGYWHSLRRNRVQSTAKRSI